jgi:TonB family protein
MSINRIILLFLFLFIVLTLIYPPSSYSSNESITQYIIDISKDIYNMSFKQGVFPAVSSRGEIMLKLLLSPWGELKDVLISESSGNKELDSLYLKAARMRERYSPFPEELGEDDLWIDVPVIFGIRNTEKIAAEDKVGFEVDFPDKDLLSINDAFDIALENDMKAKIAEEEIELSKLKIREARRALYPNASLNYLETTGKTTTNVQDFTDKEYKLKFEYPLYYGWRLRYAVDQAVSNMKASRYNYDEVLQNLKVEVEVSFYSYLTSRVALEIQKSLLGEAERIFDTADKRFKAGLSTKAEFLQVESQLKQIKYQVLSSENELDLAKLTLSQSMNVENPEDLRKIVDLDVDLMNIKLGEADIRLDECVDLAFKYRPDLKSKGYMVDFNDYETKIAKSKDQLKVDLTGSYGKSGGAFASEPLTLNKDWYLGVKVSKPFGANTLSASYTKEETSEKHGETSRTQSLSKAMEFGILDNLQSFSEKKSAEIALKKSAEELQKTKDAILKEVKEAYLNYKKGLVQLGSNINKISQREEELKITKARAELNEVPVSELLQSHIQLADEKIFYAEAFGSLYQSLAKLNKATGYALFLDDKNFVLANVK